MDKIIQIFKMIAVAVFGNVVTLYVLVSKYLSAFIMNGGKSEEQIIEAHKDDTNKRFLVKYPEADINVARNYLMAMGFIFAFGSSVFAFKYTNKDTSIVAAQSMEVDEDFEVEAPQTEQVKPPPPPPPPPPEIEVVEDEEILEDEPEIEDTEIEEDEVVEVPEVAEEEEEVEEQEVFFVVEDMPKFKGCEGLSGDAAATCTMGKIQSYIAKVDYPQIAMDNDIEGKVWVSFVVDKTGSVVDVKILRGVDKLLDNAALKHIKRMPKFASPGKQRGKPVKLMYKVPISFQLE